MKKTIVFILGLILALSFAKASLAANAIDGLKPGEWYEVPNSKIRSVLPNPIRGYGIEGPGAIVWDWSGGTFDTTRDRLLVWGGGHSGYGGNEVYAFSLNTLQWQRITEPSPSIPDDPPAACPSIWDGQPASRHTYAGLAYIPQVDMFWANSGSLYCQGGNSDTLAWGLELGKTPPTWKRLKDSPTFGLGNLAAYDPVTGSVFMQNALSYGNNAHDFMEYVPSTDQWISRNNEYYNRGGWWEDHMVGAIDPQRRLFVAVGDISNPPPVRVYNLTNYSFSSPTTTGPKNVENTSAPGFVFDSRNKVFVGWPGSGASVYSLDPSTWVWKQLVPAQTNTVIPTGASVTGTYGRFQYSATYDAFVLYNDIDQNVFILKNPLSSGIPPTDTIAPTVPTNLSATAVSSSQINLSWTASTDNVAVTGYRVERCQGSACTTFSQIATPIGTSYNDTGLLANTTYRYRVRATDAAGNLSGYSSIISATTQTAVPSSAKLYDFNSGGPLVCSGTAPNITCDDSGSSKWDTYNYDPSDGRFYHDINNYLRVNWVDYDQTHGPDYGWLEIDNTKGAKGTSGSLKIRVTGSANNGGYIIKKAEQLNYPSRVGTGIGGNVYMEFFPSGRHWPGLAGKNRVSAYIWIPKNWMSYNSYGWPSDYNLHVGTNVCSQADEPCIDRTGCSPYSWGEPCNGSSSHFYHYFTFGQWGGGGWVRILLDGHPQWERQGKWNEQNNPTLSTFGEPYIPSIARMYFDVTGGTEMRINTPFEAWIDEVEGLSLSSDFAEPNQNDDTISSVALGYYPDNDGHWEISWSSGADSNRATYQAKYSLTEFTNSNFNTNGQPITPLANAAQGGLGFVGKQRPEDYSFNRYTTYFNLSSQYEQPGSIVYFAIKDVSQAGQHGTAEIGWEADTRTSTDTRIHTIDYIIPGQSPSLKGDVNSDSSVDILDVQALVNHILGTQDYGTSADVNSDGSVDVLDVQEVVNVILGG